MSIDRISAPPRWAVRGAYLIPLLILPSAIWRVTLLFRHGDPLHALADGGWYLVLLSVGSVALGVSTMTLVRPWGAWVPPFLPLAGGSLVVLVSVYATMNSFFDLVSFTPALQVGDEVFAKPGADVLALYAPMALWGPLLLLIALDYRRRRGARPVH